jgi:hypothetical protein
MKKKTSRSKKERLINFPLTMAGNQPFTEEEKEVFASLHSMIFTPLIISLLKWRRTFLKRLQSKEINVTGKSMKLMMKKKWR